MKILMLTTTFPRWDGDSTASFILDLSKNMCKAGVEVVVLAPHHPGAAFFEELEGLRIYRFPYFWPYRFEKLCYDGGILANRKKNFFIKLQVPFLFLSELFAALYLIRKERIDVVHAQWILPSGLVAVLCRKFWSVPVIVSSNGSDVAIMFKKRMWVALSRYSLRRADKVTASSTYLKESIVKLGISPGKISVVPFGVDMESFKRPFKKEKGLDILYVGRLSAEKGVDDLIKSMQPVKERFPGVRLTIIGDGPLREDLVRLSKDLSLEGNVFFLGGMDHRRIPGYLHEADVFVLPSRSEGLSVVLLEAMASGTPVIANRVGGVTDIVVDGRNGFLIAPGDNGMRAEKIIQLLTDDGLRDKFAVNGLSTVREKFSWDAVEKELMGIYGSLEKKRVSARP